jgi:hypothetical protein
MVLDVQPKGSAVFSEIDARRKNTPLLDSIDYSSIKEDPSVVADMLSRLLFSRVPEFIATKLPENYKPFSKGVTLRQLLAGYAGLERALGKMLVMSTQRDDAVVLAGKHAQDILKSLPETNLILREIRISIGQDVQASSIDITELYLEDGLANGFHYVVFMLTEQDIIDSRNMIASQEYMKAVMISFKAFLEENVINNSRLQNVPSLDNALDGIVITKEEFDSFFAINQEKPEEGSQVSDN